ncbi:MAG: prolyl oligopeptidase family serine peptidase [Bacteroidia bacterium]
MKHFGFLFAILAGLLVFGFSQEKVKLSPEDYQRADFFQWKNVRNHLYTSEVTPHWLPDNSGFWYEEITREGTHRKRADLREMEILDYLAVDSTFRTSVDPLISRSPDGKWLAFARDFNLFVRNTETGEEIALSTAGKKNYEYGATYGWFDLMEGETENRPQNFSVQWSYDSKKILTQICDFTRAEKMYLLDWAKPELFRPRLLSYYRGSPGDTTLIYEIPVIFDLEKLTETRIDIKPVPHFIPLRLEWSADGQRLFGGTWERGFKKMDILSVNATDGAVKVLYSEESPTHVDNRMFTMVINEQIQKIFFTSERNGWNQLYAVGIADGKLETVTHGEFVIWRIVHTDAEEKMFYFLASGKEKGRNPYFSHLYCVGFDGTGMKLLTKEDAHHEVDFSPDGRYFVDNYSTVGQPTISVLRNARNGKTLMELSKADASDLYRKGWKNPEPFVATGRDGKTEIYGALWKPTNFDPARKYPIIDASYTGPHTQVFPKSFLEGLRNNNQPLAELGFIVVAVDGMGTIGRGRAFSDVSYKNMGYNLTDHVLAIRQLGKKYSWIDTTRVGIFGHSAGGYDAAHGLLQFPDFYKVGVASSGDHDFRMEKAWWPEMYMGWPVDSAYHQQSNITMAANLKGKLLIVHGGLDHNVNPSTTFKLAEAFVNAGKDFDMLILPSQEHGYRGNAQDFFTKKRWNYFVTHLLGAEPVWDYETKSR